MIAEGGSSASLVLLATELQKTSSLLYSLKVQVETTRKRPVVPAT